jgi:hypothetical protein
MGNLVTVMMLGMMMLLVLEFGGGFRAVSGVPVLLGVQEHLDAAIPGAAAAAAAAAGPWHLGPGLWRVGRDGVAGPEQRVDEPVHQSTSAPSGTSANTGVGPVGLMMLPAQTTIQPIDDIRPPPALVQSLFAQWSNEGPDMTLASTATPADDDAGASLAGPAWSAWELRLLRDALRPPVCRVSIRTIHALAAQLNRSYNSVRSRLYVMRNALCKPGTPAHPGEAGKMQRRAWDAWEDEVLRQSLPAPQCHVPGSVVERLARTVNRSVYAVRRRLSSMQADRCRPAPSPVAWSVRPVRDEVGRTTHLAYQPPVQQENEEEELVRMPVEAGTAPLADDEPLMPEEEEEEEEMVVEEAVGEAEHDAKSATDSTPAPSANDWREPLSALPIPDLALLGGFEDADGFL